MNTSIWSAADHSVGIVGLGFVGGTLLRWFRKNGRRRGKDLFCFDNNQSLGYRDDVGRANVIFICVPTPSRGKSGRCDTSIVEGVVKQFAYSDKHLVIRSTVPPGTARRLARKYGVSIVSYPEFLTEKNAWEDFQYPDRQVFGAANGPFPYMQRILSAMLPRSEIVAVSATEAEAIKYFSNVFGALKVNFANVAAIYCEAVGADYNTVRAGIAADKRIGDAWLNVDHAAYRGFGGYCFPKDTRAIIAHGRSLVKKIVKTNPKLAELLKIAVKYLRAAYSFNEELLAAQGLSIEDVSGHIGTVKRKNRK